MAMGCGQNETIFSSTLAVAGFTNVFVQLIEKRKSSCEKPLPHEPTCVLG
jgi:hypothetical protein